HHQPDEERVLQNRHQEEKRIAVGGRKLDGTLPGENLHAAHPTEASQRPARPARKRPNHPSVITSSPPPASISRSIPAHGSSEESGGSCTSAKARCHSKSVCSTLAAVRERSSERSIRTLSSETSSSANSSRSNRKVSRASSTFVAPPSSV